MARTLILAIDQGTTGTTALLVDGALQVVHKVKVDFAQVYPQPGWVEHRGDDIWTSLEKAVVQCLQESGHSSRDVAAIGVTNQRETVSLFEPGGRLVHNFIVWQCRRTADQCEALRAQGHEELVRSRTGLLLDPYFSATKIAWLLEKVPDSRSRCENGQLLVGTIDTWLIHRLSGGALHVTDATNASRTMLMNIETGEWDASLLELFRVPRACLPTICSSSELYGHTKGLGFLEDGLPICGLAGDQQAALFGQACFENGEAKLTLGTGAFVLLHTGKNLVRSRNGLLSSVALRLGNQTSYCLEGSAFIAGAAVQWLRDGLGLIERSSQVEALALSVPDSAEVNFVPAFSGLGAPYWRPGARALLSGVSRGTNKGHMARAVLEGIALQNGDLLDAMRQDGAQLKNLKVDGGAAANDLLLQMHADYLNVPCVRPRVVDATGLGAAALAGLSLGIFKNSEALKEAWQEDRTFTPVINEAARARRIARWHEAVAKA